MSRFKETSPKLIQTADNTLSTHREPWKYVLANLFLAVSLLGVGYLIAMLINKKLTDHYTFFNETKSRKQLVELENSIVMGLA